MGLGVGRDCARTSSSPRFLYVAASAAHLRATLADMNLTGVAALVVLLVLLSGLRIAREYQRAVVFRLGRYTGLRGPGLFWLIPLGIENVTRIDLRVVTATIEQEETIPRHRGA